MWTPHPHAAGGLRGGTELAAGGSDKLLRDRSQGDGLLSRTTLSQPSNPAKHTAEVSLVTDSGGGVGDTRTGCSAPGWGLGDNATGDTTATRAGEG